MDEEQKRKGKNYKRKYEKDKRGTSVDKGGIE